VYYGFFGVTLSWQLMFLVIGSDRSFSEAMIPAMGEKVSSPSQSYPCTPGASCRHLGWARLDGRNVVGAFLSPTCELPPKIQYHERPQTNVERGSHEAESSARNSSRREVAHLEDIPNVGPAVAAICAGWIMAPAELPGRDPYTMYEDLCCITGQRHDPCVLDTFIALSGSWRESRRGRGGNTRGTKTGIGGTKRKGASSATCRPR